MKKIFVIILETFLISNCFAQKLEIIKKYNFDDNISYFEKGIDDYGYNTNPGIVSLLTWKNNYYFFTLSLESKNSKWIFDNGKYSTININECSLFKMNKDFLYFFTDGYIKLYANDFTFSNFNYNIHLESDLYISNSLYLTENMLFAQTNDNQMVCWTLLEEGKTEYHGKEETKKMFDEGLAEKLGYHENKSGSTKYFGEFNITTGTGPNYSNILNNIVFKTKGYENENSIKYWGYYIGTDKRGLSYFYQSSNMRTDFDFNKPIELKIAVLDPWTREVTVVELPPGDWNPARNERGLIAECSQCIDDEGNIYFTDCNKEKGCYEIKKLSNDWIKKYDFYKREVGRMNANHIPLQTAAKSSAENNGYNFDHEYLWILKHGKEWCKVRKVDGREGYVETKYINFGNENESSSAQSKTSAESSSKVAVNKILKASDNLRLRQEEATSSAIITTMLKGTKVKILKLGKAEKIDGILSNWVQVEVQSGAKDKDGKEIKAGTVGWCYGGYLE